MLLCTLPIILTDVLLYTGETATTFLLTIFLIFSTLFSLALSNGCFLTLVAVFIFAGCGLLKILAKLDLALDSTFIFVIETHLAIVFFV